MAGDVRLDMTGIYMEPSSYLPIMIQRLLETLPRHGSK